MSIWVVVKGQIVLVYQNIISIIWVMEKGINFKRKNVWNGFICVWDIIYSNVTKRSVPANAMIYICWNNTVKKYYLKGFV